MNQTGKLADGSMPLATWLKNAVVGRLASERRLFFRRALEPHQFRNYDCEHIGELARSRCPWGRNAAGGDAFKVGDNDAGGPCITAPVTFISYGGPDTRDSRRADAAGHAERRHHLLLRERCHPREEASPPHA